MTIREVMETIKQQGIVEGGPNFEQLISTLEAAVSDVEKLISEKTAEAEKARAALSIVHDTKVVNRLEWRTEVKAMRWDEAVEYAKNQGDGWRLPTMQELVALWDYNTGTCPAFPEYIGALWSSQPDASSKGLAWAVECDPKTSGGMTAPQKKDDLHGVRLVRDPQILIAIKVTKNKNKKGQKVKKVKEAKLARRGPKPGATVASKPCPACGTPTKARRFSYLCEDHRTKVNLRKYRKK